MDGDPGFVGQSSHAVDEVQMLDARTS